MISTRREFCEWAILVSFENCQGWCESPYDRRYRNVFAQTELAPPLVTSHSTGATLTDLSTLDSRLERGAAALQGVALVASNGKERWHSASVFLPSASSPRPSIYPLTLHSPSNQSLNPPPPSKNMTHHHHTSPCVPAQSSPDPPLPCPAHSTNSAANPTPSAQTLARRTLLFGASAR